MAEFEINSLSLGAGQIGICPAPGRRGAYGEALEAILAWGPSLVLTMCEADEMAQFGATGFGDDLCAAGCDWLHFPVVNYGAPDDGADWSALLHQAREVLNSGDRVLAHCAAGCGRSGMVLMRLMCEAGEPADQAIARLREVRACAVETHAQRVWAGMGG